MQVVWTRLFILAPLWCWCQTVKFEVRRTVSSSRSGIAPFKSSSQFVSMNSVCFPSFCWDSDAKCSSSFSCCKCVCEAPKIFFSLADGCVTARMIPSLTRRTGECLFITQALGLAHVPAFVGSSSFQVIEISLPAYADFDLHDAHTEATCVAGTISYYDEHGHKLALISNSCQETIQAYKEGAKHYIKWVSTNDSDWGLMAGKLLGLALTCTSKSGDMFSSCLVFEVHGLYQEGDHPVAPVGKPCSTIAPTTASSALTKVESTSSAATASALVTSSLATEGKVNATTFLIAGTKSLLTGYRRSVVSSVAIAAVVGAVVLVTTVVVFVVVFVLLRRRKDRARMDKPRAESTIPFIVKGRTKGNIYDDANAYAVPATLENYEGKDAAGNLNDGGYTYIPTRSMSRVEYARSAMDSEQKEAGPCDHDYEETAALASSIRDGSIKRDVLGAPMEASNPCYGSYASGEAVESDSFEQNPLYATIEELRT